MRTAASFRALKRAEVALRTAAGAFALQGPVKDATDSTGRKVNTALLRAARHYAQVFEQWSKEST